MPNGVAERVFECSGDAHSGIPIGDVLSVLSDDPGIVEDLPAWCRSNGQELLGLEKAGRIYKATIRRAR